VASRRKAEELILEGDVRVNGKVIQEMGFKADPEKDAIKVKGKLLHFPQTQTYLLLHKPPGYITSLSDPQGRPTVKDLLKGVRDRVFPVGRLDYDTEGLLLLTNDGDLAYSLMHPAHEIEKCYLAKIKGTLEEKEMSRLMKGISLGGGGQARKMTAPAKVRGVRKAQENSWVEITLHEGKNRQVRKMLEAVGHLVIRLKRTRYAFLTLEGVPPGAYRRLTPIEVKELKSLSGKSVARPMVGRVKRSGPDKAKSGRSGHDP